jgi:hypothetical protein
MAPPGCCLETKKKGGQHILLKAGKFWFVVVLLMWLPGRRAGAQVDRFEPEVDVHYKIAPALRLTFQAKQTREASDPTTAEIGPSIDFYMKPLLKLKSITAFDLDETKPRLLLFSIGYRYLPTPGAPPKNRVEPVLTFHFPLQFGFLVTDRNRADLDWKSGNFSWRYRNRLEIEKRLALRSYHPALEAGVEPFYESQLGKWSDTAIYAGCIFPIGRQVTLNPYYEHQNNTGKLPNQSVNQFGLKLSLFL